MKSRRSFPIRACFLLVCLTIMFYAGNSAAGTWSISFGSQDSSRDQTVRSVRQTSDGGYILAGFRGAAGPNYIPDLWVIKLGITGGVLWQKTYGGNALDGANSIQQTSDGGYIVAGYTQSFGSGHMDVWVLKLNADGAVLWEKTYGGSDEDEANSIQQTSDGGYIVAGYTRSFGVSTREGWLLKLDADGAVLWQKRYASSQPVTGRCESINAIQQTDDGGYIVAGHTCSSGTGFIYMNAWVSKLNGAGEILWQKSYGGGDEEAANSIQQTNDGGYIVAGYAASVVTGDSEVLVMKLSGGGEVSWQKTYGGSKNDVANAVQQTIDGDYIVAGITESFGAGGSDLWVLKLDEDGGMIWQRTYGGTGSEEFESIHQTSDGGYIVAGKSASWTPNISTDGWVLRLDGVGGLVGCLASVVGTSSATISSVTVPTVQAGGLDGVITDSSSESSGATAAGVFDKDFYVIEICHYPEPVLPVADETWSKSYQSIDESGSDMVHSIRTTADGGYIMAGGGSLGVAKLDRIGEVVWAKTYRTSREELISVCCIQQASDGGYTALGVSYSGYWRRPDVEWWVMKLSGTGDLLWQKSYGINGLIPMSIRETSDGGYIVAGGDDRYPPGIPSDNAIWVQKLAGDGAILLWEKSYDLNRAVPSHVSIRETSDGGYLVTGDNQSLSSEVDLWLMRLDGGGGVVWANTYTESVLGFFNTSIRQTSDGGYVVAGNTSSFEPGFAMWVVKVDGNGGIAWSKTYSGIGGFGRYSIQQTTDGGYIAASDTTSFGAGASDMWVVRLDSNGAILWQRTYGGLMYDSAASIQQTEDGGYIVGGYTESFGAGDRKVWLNKLDRNGMVAGCLPGVVGTAAAVEVTRHFPPADPADFVVADTAGLAQDGSVTAAAFEVSATEVCAYAEPPPPLPTPVSQESYRYDPVASPVTGIEAFLSKPLAVGDVASGALSLSVGLPTFDGPIDVFLGLFAPSIDSENLFVFRPDRSLQPLSQGLVPWRENTTEPIGEIIFEDVPTTSLPEGPYSLYLFLTPQGRPDTFYLWETHFSVP